tara:strand:- start:324 stop:563 length:240 start_codon:yes stop_codon:yes gene_type:complete
MTRAEKIIEAHQNCINLTECIESYKKYIRTNEKKIKDYEKFGYSNISKWLNHNIEIQKMVVKRLEERYKRNFRLIVSFF